MPIVPESLLISHKRQPPAPPNDYVTTPDGTAFSTTPGGTRIIYDRMFLLRCRDSPLSKTPPPNLPDIPGITTLNRAPREINLEKHVQEHQGLQYQHIYGLPNFFQFPQIYDPNNNMPDIHSKFTRPIFGGPLIQYRHRQSAQVTQEQDLFQPRYNLPVQSRMISERCTPAFGPIPNEQSSPFPHIPFIHPMQGPTTPIFDQPSPKMSQLAMWRRAHARTGDPALQGYTTAKAPQLRSSFTQDAEQFYPGPGLRRMSSGYSSQIGSARGHSNLVMTIPDDPSIIAYKPSHLKA